MNLKKTTIMIRTNFNFLLIIVIGFLFSACGNVENGQTVTDVHETKIKSVNNDLIDDAITVIHNRKSVRQYTNEQVSKAQIETLLKAGMAAPTAGNRQPWYLIAIKDNEVLVDLTEYLPYGQMLNEASAAIVVCGDLAKANLDGPEYWVQDCAAVTQNILLAAEAIGLGAVWIGVYPHIGRTEDLMDYFDLDGLLVPLSVISIGYPKGDPQPKDKWDPEKVLWITGSE